MRNNALRVLALKLAKVPPTAHEVLLKALQSSNYQTAGYEAAGLVSIEVTDTNQETVAKALNASRDVKYRIGLLDAIRSGAQPSEALFAVSRKYLNDLDEKTQQVLSRLWLPRQLIRAGP